MQVLRETTNWRYPNHDYAINDKGMLFAFRRKGDKDWQKFSKPKNFSRRLRSFKKLKEVPDNFVTPFENTPISLLDFM